MEFVHVIIWRTEFFLTIQMDILNEFYTASSKHVWTYAAGLSDDYDYKCCNCPCATIPGPSPPAFVGNDYYCESGDVGTYDIGSYYLSDPLWDGSGCGSGNGCCAQIGMSWFYRKLQITTAKDFEFCISKNQNFGYEDIAVEKLELFVL